jgi:non-heme chloroperoxidase
MKKIIFSATALLATATLFAQIEAVNAHHLSTESQHVSTAYAVKRTRLSTGVTLEYVEQGSKGGTPVIFLHGLSDSWHSFETTLPHLPATVHAFALSQRGHGNSEKNATDYSTKAFAADVAAFIRQQGLGPVVIVGHSMGGVNAMRFAVDYPQLTRALVILGSEANFQGNAVLADFRKDVMAMPDGPMDSSFMEAFQGSTLVNPIDSAYYRTLVAEGMKVPMSIFKTALNGLAVQNLLPRLAGYKKPVLVIWGDKDNFCDAGSQQAIRKAMPHSRFLAYAKTGHAVQWEAPQRVAADLLQFLQPLSPEPK